MAEDKNNTDTSASNNILKDAAVTLTIDGAPQTFNLSTMHDEYAYEALYALLPDDLRKEADRFADLAKVISYVNHVNKDGALDGLNAFGKTVDDNLEYLKKRFGFSAESLPLLGDMLTGKHAVTDAISGVLGVGNAYLQELINKPPTPEQAQWIGLAYGMAELEHRENTEKAGFFDKAMHWGGIAVNYVTQFVTNLPFTEIFQALLAGEFKKAGSLFMGAFPDLDAVKSKVIYGEARGHASQTLKNAKTIAGRNVVDVVDLHQNGGTATGVDGQVYTVDGNGNPETEVNSDGQVVTLYGQAVDTAKQGAKLAKENPIPTLVAAGVGGTMFYQGTKGTIDGVAQAVMRSPEKAAINAKEAQNAAQLAQERARIDLQQAKEAEKAANKAANKATPGAEKQAARDALSRATENVQQKTTVLDEANNQFKNASTEAQKTALALQEAKDTTRAGKWIKWSEPDKAKGYNVFRQLPRLMAKGATIAMGSIPKAAMSGMAGVAEGVVSGTATTLKVTDAAVHAPGNAVGAVREGWKNITGILLNTSAVAESTAAAAVTGSTAAAVADTAKPVSTLGAAGNFLNSLSTRVFNPSAGGLMRGGGRLLGKLAVPVGVYFTASDVHTAATSENKFEATRAKTSLSFTAVGTVIGGVIGGFVAGAPTGGVGAVPGAIGGAALGGAAGGALDVFVGGLISEYISGPPDQGAVTPEGQVTPEEVNETLKAIKEAGKQSQRQIQQGLQMPILPTLPRLGGSFTLNGGSSAYLGSIAEVSGGDDVSRVQPPGSSPAGNDVLQQMFGVGNNSAERSPS